MGRTQEGHDVSNNTHSVAIGYLLWIFGFTGAHRFYFGKKWSGLLWLCTGGLFGVGWLIDVFFIPNMDREADHRYAAGRSDYTVAWVLQTFGGYLGLHHFYLGNITTGLIWLVTGGLCGIGWAYDFWRMNELVHEANLEL
jgi:TM2 domain-containing membrane protein YozV